MMEKRTVLHQTLLGRNRKGRRAYYNGASKFTLEIVSTDYRPVACFSQKVQKRSDNSDIEDFIAVKGLRL
jgi:hypothetical protein